MSFNLTRPWQGAAVVLAVLAGSTLLAQAPQTAPAPPPGDFLKRPPVTRLDPAVQQQMFLLPPGYKIEPVLTDPLIEDPVGVTFDGNGRMYVLEMRSYMRDADGSNSREPISRISRHEDRDGDGVYETHTVFADRLVLPRMAFPLEDGAVLVLETDNRDLYKYTDTNGDGVADKKEVVAAGFGRVTNMEWQPGGMVWALDNWLYTTYNPFRLRIAPGGKILREETDVNGGQWGTNQDNYGKTWFVDAGTEIGPVNFQVPIVYGAINVPDNFEPDFQTPYSAPGGLSDMQGGMNRVRMPEGTLNHFTAAAGPEIYRGDRLPADLQGDLLFTEPVGRLVRRAKVVVTDGLTQLKNVYPKSEFIRSTDPLFRPVNIANAPDGTFYISDMYTGIIQDAQFVGPGSYLRRKVEQYALDKQHNWGRIWRVTADGMTPDRTRPQMYAASAATLVQYLQHPNGWWRDTAQKLLVLRQDKTVVPALKTMVRSSTNQLGRIHAVWTLEGLQALDPILNRELLHDADPQMRIQAIRASETAYKSGNVTYAVDYRNMTRDPDPNVVIQAMLTLNLRKVSGAVAAIQAARDTTQSRGVKTIAEQLLKPARAIGQPASNDAGMGYLNLTPDERGSLQRGESTYRELCFSCHGNDGMGTPMAGAPAGTTMAPPLAGSTRVTGHREYVLRVLLSGLTGPVNGKEYNGGAVMVPMGANSDQWIADVANYVRNAFGNTGRPYITPEQATLTRRGSNRRSPWTLAELEPLVPTPVGNADAWKLSASVNLDAANLMTSGRWDTGGPQRPDMWFQIELPQVTNVAEVQLDATAPTGRGNAGLGGFGGLGVSGSRGAAPAAARGGAPAAPTGPVVGISGRGAAGRGAAPAGSGPAAFVLTVSSDGTNWSPPVARGQGTTPTTVIAFRPLAAKFIRITQTGTSPVNDPWAVQGIRVYETKR
ncbi:MAG: c-type cytochrome [Acidobacteriota bacterium]